MSVEKPDSVEQWAPLFTRYFTDEQLLDPNYALSQISGGGTFCNLCDAPVAKGEPNNDHLRKHRDELQAWRKRKTRETEKQRTARLKEAREEKRRVKEAEREFEAQQKEEQPKPEQPKKKRTSPRKKKPSPRSQTRKRETKEQALTRKLMEFERKK